MNYEEVIILCFRTDNPGVLMVPGTSKTKCEKCQHDVWISPSSLKIQKQMKTKVVCDVCEKMKPGTVDVLPLNKEQIGEIKDGLWDQKNRN